MGVFDDKVDVVVNWDAVVVGVSLKFTMLVCAEESTPGPVRLLADLIPPCCS